MGYITSKEFIHSLGWERQIPARLEPLEPLIFQNDKYYFESENVIAGTEKVYMGEDLDNLTLLISEEDYTLNAKRGFIVLTSEGQTKVNGSSLWGEYEVITLGISDELINSAIERCSNLVNSLCNAIFVDTTKPNPVYGVRDRVTENQGHFNRYYSCDRLPIKDIKSNLAQAMIKEATLLQLTEDSGRLFPPTGKILIDTEIIEYTSIEGDIMTVVRGENAQDHEEGAEVHTTYVIISSLQERYLILNYPEHTSTILRYGQEFIIEDYQNIYIYETPRNYRVRFPIPGRTIIHHLYGYDSIPEEIKRLVIILVKRELTSDTVSKSLIEGRNEFKPEMLDADQMEMRSIINNYRINKISNV